jgi:hypothetical protein
MVRDARKGALLIARVVLNGHARRSILIDMKMNRFTLKEMLANG